MTRTFRSLLLSLLTVGLAAGVVASRPAAACTSFLVTRGASVDGSVMITYAADAHDFYGTLYFAPEGQHPEGSMVEIYEWDSGKHLGRIPQARTTYRVVGNMNEHQVAIAETTYGGRKELKNPKGIVDYGSLMYLALQRARTAREAIQVMGDLTARHGYHSSGESFSIADPREAWIMDMIGKGPGRKGAVWVARRVPDGYISAHANQARIRTFPLNDPKNCLYAPDVISFARERGYFKGQDADFSFADAYAPMTYKALRVCEARVWAMFRRAAPSARLTSDYVRGVKDAKPLPLWIKPDRKLAAPDVMALMRDHFEGTVLDLTQGVGAGPYNLPYRWRPLYWKIDGHEYINERSTSTQQTGFSFVSQSRRWLPSPIGGLLWFGVDDTYSTVYVPIYSGITRAPKPYAAGTGSFREFTWDSAFWVFNFVANYAYGRYRDMIRDIQQVQRELEGSFLGRQAAVERAARKLYATDPELARDYLTKYSAEQADRTVTRWRRLGEALIAKYLDGNVRDAQGKVTHPGYPKTWYRRVARECGSHCRAKRLPGEPPPKKKKVKPGCDCPPAGAATAAPRCPPVKQPAPGPRRGGPAAPPPRRR